MSRGFFWLVANFAKMNLISAFLSLCLNNVALFSQTLHNTITVKFRAVNLFSVPTIVHYRNYKHKNCGNFSQNNYGVISSDRPDLHKFTFPDALLSSRLPCD